MDRLVLRWEARQTLGRATRLLGGSVAVVMLGCLSVALVWKGLAERNWLLAASLGACSAPFLLLRSRVWGKWPYHSGNFVYVRDGHILARIGVSTLNLQQNDIDLDDLKHVVFEPKRLVLVLTDAKVVWNKSSFPFDYWSQTRDLLHEICIEREIRRTKMVVK